MNNYSLRISRHYHQNPAMPQQYNVTCSAAPEHKDSSAIPSSTFASWEDLYVALDSVHVDAATLTEAKKKLDAKGTYQLQITLADDQLERL